MIIHMCRILHGVPYCNWIFTHCTQDCLSAWIHVDMYLKHILLVCFCVPSFSCSKRWIAHSSHGYFFLSTATFVVRNGKYVYYAHMFPPVNVLFCNIERKNWLFTSCKDRKVKKQFYNPVFSTCYYSEFLIYILINLIFCCLQNNLMNL